MRRATRWLAAAAWVVVAAFLFSRNGSSPVLPVADWITAVVCGSVALAIVAGGRIAQVGASIGAVLGGLVTILSPMVIGLCAAVDSVGSPWLPTCGDVSWWPLPVALALTGVSVLAEREVERALMQGVPAPRHPHDG